MKLLICGGNSTNIWAELKFNELSEPELKLLDTVIECINEMDIIYRCRKLILIKDGTS